MENKTAPIFLSFLFSLFLVACGGGDNNSEPTPSANQPPQVAISGESSVDELSELTLSATANDADGSITSIVWQQSAGPQLNVQSSDNQLLVTIPSVDADTVITFSVEVTDNQGATASGTFSTTILDVNSAPQVEVTGPQVVTSNGAITLNANASDLDGEIRSYVWTQTSGPQVSWTEAGGQISFIAPSVAVNTQITFEVLVTDSFGEQKIASFAFEVEANLAPEVTVSGPKTVVESEQATLIATATDVDGTISNYSWQQISGPMTSSTMSSSAELTFIAPEVEIDTDIQFQVDVMDNQGATTSATYVVSVTDRVNVAPVVTVDPVADVEELTTVTINVDATDSDGSISQLEWLQQSGPSIDFTQDGLSITFQAPDVTVNSEVVFIVTATDNLGASSSTTLRFTIVHVNAVPSVEDIAFTSEFNEATQFNVTALDNDSDPLTVSFSNELGGATIETLDAENFIYQFTPALNSISQAPFLVTVSDGTDTAEANVTVTIVDTSPATIFNVSPALNSETVSVNTSVSFAFSDVMKSESFTFNESAGACVGSVQLSSDNFSNCLALTSVQLTGPTADTSEYFNGVELKADLLESTQYQLRVTDELVNFDDTAVNASVVTEFTTGSEDLKITEVVAIRFSNDTPWFELYNGTDSPLDLSQYSVRVKSRDSTDNSVALSTVFSLPQQLVAPKEYVIIHSGFGDNLLYDASEQNSGIAFIGEADSTIRPYWFINGFVELLTADQSRTVDFVRFGSDRTVPITAQQWSSGDAAPRIDNVTGSSIKRDAANTDTNSAADWSYSLFITPAGENDVTCSEDLDQDGIPDCSEQPGSTFAGLPLYEWGARVNQQDIFIEVDYMDSEDAGILPHKTALEKVVSSFAEQNIAVHFDVGDLYHQVEGLSVADHDLGGGDRVVFRQYTPYNFNQGVESLFHYKMANFDMRRKPIFHYMLMANSRNVDGSAGSSGVAEISGNDLMVSLGNWGLSLDTEISSNLAYNYQAATIMHELGHNLGLEHGGDNGVNFKPNHLSIMNYLYQLRGLATIGNNEGDRYYSSRYRNDPDCGVQTADLTNSPYGSPDNFVMSYSHGVGNPLDETNIIEANGLGYPGSVSVDYNCNANTEEILNQDVNGDSNISSLSDVDEWSLIELRFYSLFAGNRLGLDTTNSVNSDASNRVTQRIIEEPAPPAYLLEEIKQAQSLDIEQ